MAVIRVKKGQSVFINKLRFRLEPDEPPHRLAAVAAGAFSGKYIQIGRKALAFLPGLQGFFEARLKGGDLKDYGKFVEFLNRHDIILVGPVVTENSIGMKLVDIDKGTFLMGSLPGDPAAKDDEKHQHKVEITKPFLMGMHEVTRGQFRQFVLDSSYKTQSERGLISSVGIDLSTGVVSEHPTYNWLHPGIPQEDDHPVVCVSWDDASEFCKWLSGKEGKRYRLPTETEWEYACRAGTTMRYFFGDDPAGLLDYANTGDQSLKEKWIWQGPDPPFPKGTPLPTYAAKWNDHQPFTSPAGSFAPNPWGLFDMAGNGGEWCSDWYAENYYKISPDKDPQGPDEKDATPIDVSGFFPGEKERKLHVARGGVWLDPVEGFRSSDRGTIRRHPVRSAADISFRVVREK